MWAFCFSLSSFPYRFVKGHDRASLGLLASLWQVTGKLNGRQVEAPGLSLPYGEIESLTVGGACDGQIVVKVQAFPVSNSESRAFESVQDLVLNHGFDACKAIDYWVVNPASGNKFLSFSLDSALISKIASGSIGAEEMAGEVSDLWVDSSVVQ